MPIRQDLALWRGNNAPPLVWTLPDDAPPDADYFLSVSALGRNLFERDTLAGGLVRDEESGTLSWLPSLAESRAVPEGRVATYEIEQHAAGAETTIFFGAITGSGGINPDTDPLLPSTLDASDPDNSPFLLLGWLA